MCKIQMNNEGLQALIDEYGNRINIIIFDNDNKIFIGYKSSPIKDISELKLETKGGVDFVGVPLIPKDPKLQRKGMTGMAWHPTECVQSVITVDEGFEDYLWDPFDLM